MKEAAVKPKRLKTSVEPSKLELAEMELFELFQQAQSYRIRKFIMMHGCETLKDRTYD